MKSRLVAGLAGLLALSLYSLAASADSVLSLRDFKVAGDGLLAYDSASSAEWLNLTYTAGISFSTVANG